MQCLGCYREVEGLSYCLPCRKKLFDGAKIPPVLPFEGPKTENLGDYQQHTKNLSISGVQLKYSLRLEDRQLKLTEKKGQYILKPIPPSRQLSHLEAVPENEHLTMQMATQVFGILTAENALIRFDDGVPAYLTRRFDVLSDGSKRMQEDFAQLSSRNESTHGKSYKYDGTYAEIGALIKKYVAAAAPALEAFFEIIVFNYVFSNGDAHMKNFSLQRADTGEYMLTPAYDLMSTILHTPRESDVALDLYEKDMNTPFYTSYGFYGKDDFMKLAEKMGLVQKRAERIIEQFIVKEAVAEAFVHKSFLSDELKKLYVHTFRDRVRRLQFTL